MPETEETKQEGLHAEILKLKKLGMTEVQIPRSLESESVKFAWSMGFTEERVIRETEILFAGTGDRNHCHNGDTGSQFFKERDQDV